MVNFSSDKNYLWWSHIEAYEECPQKFLWKNGFGVIDLGRGPGKGKKLPEKKRSEHNSLMGRVLSSAMENFYNQEWWRDPPTLTRRITEFIEKEFAYRLTRTHIEWDENYLPGKERWDKSPPKEVLRQICVDGMLNYLRTMKRNRLLGPYAKSEVDLIGYVNKYVAVAGRPDLIVRREDSGVGIYDGKNSVSPGKHNNPDQLKWYALCFFLAFQTMPSRLSFVYFRYPEGSPPKDLQAEADKESWTGLVDVPFTREDLKGLAVRSVETRKVMLREYFDPTPSTKACTYCDFSSECPAYKDWKLSNARPKTELEEKIEETGGILFFGGDGNG